MALRARMHPRNIYKKPPNFKELAIQYPEFRKYVKQELSGRITLDYNDRKAVLELSKILLVRDFNLRVEINEKRLIPRVPLCLNYVLWIEDLIEALNKDDIRGIDIGTGSVCIYSLLASTKGWNMLATEIDRVSFENATENVKRNNLSDKITVKFVEDSNKILNGVIDDGLTYDFCMCNPPFFDSGEKPLNRTKKRKIIEVAASYVNTDVITSGGEVEFIKKLITESEVLRDKVKIYTTLVGKKSDFMSLKKELVKINPVSVTDTEFCQGNTIRWGLAWTFLNIDLKECNKFEKSKKSKVKPFQYYIPKQEYSLEQTSEKLLKILNDLKISYTKEYIFGGYVFTLKAYENTWSHQRRKNRLKKREHEEHEEGASSMETGNEQSPEQEADSSPSNKKMKQSEDVENPKSKTVLVECLTSLKEEDSNIALEMLWLSGNKESLHQIFQYIKNNWAKSDDVGDVEEMK